MKYHMQKYNDRPLLSICIPTYNRDTFLQQCLASISAEIEKSKSEDLVEIVIRSNASTDTTDTVVATFTKDHPRILLTYSKNDSNIGFDRSFVKLIEDSHGKYCLSLGDDDAIFENSLAYLLETLKASTTPFYGINAWGYDSLLEKPVLHHPNINIQKDTYHKELREYIGSIKEYTNLVGIFVGLSTQLFERDSFVAFKGKEKYFDTLAVHMYVLLQVHKNNPYMVLARPIIKTRASNIRWDVFQGLGTIQGRIQSTMTIVSWINKYYNLSISPISLYIYFYVREYWFTAKEILKKILIKLKLGQSIHLYRRLRSQL
jgi:abequosyltransferase